MVIYYITQEHFEAYFLWFQLRKFCFSFVYTAHMVENLVHWFIKRILLLSLCIEVTSVVSSNKNNLFIYIFTSMPFISQVQSVTQKIRILIILHIPNFVQYDTILRNLHHCNLRISDKNLKSFVTNYLSFRVASNWFPYHLLWPCYYFC